MTVSSTVKIASVIAGVGTIVTGASIGAYSYLSKSESKEQESKGTTVTKTYPITTLLKEDTLQLITQEDDKDSVWTPKYNEFKTDHTNKEPEGIWTITNWNNVKDKEDGLNIFKELCSVNGADSVKGRTDKKYVQVKKYCTKPLTQVPSGQG